MADTTAFDSLVEKLPPAHRERFLAMSIALRNLPPDDELVLAVEAFGLTALILKEIPEDISAAIGGLRSGLSEAQREALRADVEAVLVQSIDTPSYQDLRETIHLMKEHHAQARRATDDFTNALSQTRHWLQKRHAMLPSVILGVCAGLTCGVILLVGSALVRSDRALGNALPPVEKGMVSYIETDLPDYGGKVGLIVVDGAVLGAFEDEGRGVVVIEPVSNP